MTDGNTSLLFSATIVSSGLKRIQSIFGGTTEIQKEIIARSIGL